MRERKTAGTRDSVLYLGFSPYAVSTKAQEPWDCDELIMMVSEQCESGSRNFTCM